MLIIRQEELSALRTWWKTWDKCGGDYPGCQRFILRGFQCRSCLYYDSLRFGRRSQAKYFRPPRARKMLWYPGQAARDILSACIKTAFGRIMRPDIVVQMGDNSRKRTVCFCTSWMTNWGLCSFDSSFCRSIIRLRSCDDNWSQLAFLEGF